MQLLNPEHYQPAAALLYAEVATAVQAALPLARLEHVGASAIPGAVSKGDLDICVLVAAEQHAAAVAVLQGLGYAIKPDTLRTPELCMLQADSKELDVALQVVAVGSKFEFFMHFRDALRADPELVVAYNRVKLEALALGPVRYRQEKAKFIQQALNAVPAV
ncbi:MAG: GrpB family protein [Burkholderiales bacterium]|nr:GrpB family protein [Burkholderiales bacterium]